MKHLEYKDTNNKVYKAYYDKFKKMVKQDLNGDGWFLLVKDFPFKDGDNLMFTAGEDIGKWHDKNLVSLYGKTKYIIGRCRKKGPVLTLLHFQEGDYVKEATESGLRKELKEYFKGTGVSVRTFKSLKVTDKEPDISAEDAPDPEENTATTGTSFKTLEMPKLTPAAMKAVLMQAIDTAKSFGVYEEQDFVDKVNAFKSAAPNKVRMQSALGKLNEYFSSIQPGPAESSGNDTSLHNRRDELIRLMEAEKQQAIEKLQALIGLAKEDYEGTLEQQRSLYREAQTSYESMSSQYAEELREVLAQL